MEGCGDQGPKTSRNITVSNNPPFDLAFFKRTFRTLIEWSVILDTDGDKRDQWATILNKTAPYPRTKDSEGRVVFAQATLNPTSRANITGGFPSKSYDGLQTCCSLQY